MPALCGTPVGPLRGEIVFAAPTVEQGCPPQVLSSLMRSRPRRSMISMRTSSLIVCVALTSISCSKAGTAPTLRASARLYKRWAGLLRCVTRTAGLRPSNCGIERLMWVDSGRPRQWDRSFSHRHLVRLLSGTTLSSQSRPLPVAHDRQLWSSAHLCWRRSSPRGFLYSAGAEPDGSLSPHALQTKEWERTRRFKRIAFPLPSSKRCTTHLVALGASIAAPRRRR
jgi:hypothetical protein